MLSKICKILFCLHFGVLFIYLLGSLELLPPSYKAYTKWTTHYIEPLFEQDWGMFAPVPPSSNLHVFMQYKVVKDGKSTTSLWYDVYSPVIEQNNTSFFSLNQRLMKYFHGTTMNVYRAKNKAGDTAMTVVAPLIAHSYGYKSLRNYAKIVSRNNNDLTSASDSTYLNIKFINNYFPTYERRNENFYDSNNYLHSVLETGFNKI